MFRLIEDIDIDSNVDDDDDNDDEDNNDDDDEDDGDGDDVVDDDNELQMLHYSSLNLPGSFQNFFVAK